MAVEAQVKILREEGAKAWNDWRRYHPNVVPDLSGADLPSLDLTNADFRQANLRGARLGSVVGLLPAQLAGADLTGAELPSELCEFPGLGHVGEVSRHARTNFLAVIAGCVFCWLAITQTSDGELIANLGKTELPVIGTEVPTAGFFLFAPVILLALYVYLQLYLQRMWDGLSRLPAVFPDGARLDQRAFPWMLSGLISLYVPRLKDGAPPFTWLQGMLSLVAAWFLVPMTVAWFWIRYLLVADGLWIVVHVVLLALAISFGVLFYWRAHVTLGAHRMMREGPAGRLLLQKVVAPLLIVTTSFGVTVGATYWFERSTDLWHLDFRGEEITGAAELEPDSIKKLKLLDLRHVNLRHAVGREATLFRADLKGADLSSAELHAADLRWAVLEDADLTDARLVGAKLDGAILAGTRLDGADLTDAKGLKDMMLVGACGEGAVLPSGLSLNPCPKGVEVDSAEDPEQMVLVGDRELQPGDTFEECSDCPQMVVIQMGEFLMGSPEDEFRRFASEGPPHGVGFDAPIAVGRYEVTFAQFDSCVEAGGCPDRPDDNDWGRETRPVIDVSWDDAQAYVTWLSEKTGKEYRLLSEAEWEYAARSGTKTRYSWGDDVGSDLANCGNCGSRWDDEETAPAGSFTANLWGLHDMHGNVWEWVEDCWHANYEGAPTDGSVWTIGGNCNTRVLRGGSWINRPRLVRAATRDWSSIGSRSFSIGFRVARTLDH